MILRGQQDLTNQEGLTRVFVSSDTGGTFALSVLSQRSKQKAIFDEITFEGGGDQREMTSIHRLFPSRSKDHGTESYWRSAGKTAFRFA